MIIRKNKRSRSYSALNNTDDNISNTHFFNTNTTSPKLNTNKDISPRSRTSSTIKPQIQETNLIKLIHTPRKKTETSPTSRRRTESRDSILINLDEKDHPPDINIEFLHRYISCKLPKEIDFKLFRMDIDESIQNIKNIENRNNLFLEGNFVECEYDEIDDDYYFVLMLIFRLGDGDMYL